MRLERWQEDEINGNTLRELEAEQIAKKERKAMLATGNRAERRAAMARAKKGK